MGSDLVTAEHLNRKAVVYVRQSTPRQVATDQESLRLQYALRQRARELGWREADIDVIDADLGLSGATAAHRQGFKDLVARVTLGQVGLILSTEVTRLARNCSDWYPLLDVAVIGPASSPIATASTIPEHPTVASYSASRERSRNSSCTPSAAG